ncbi:MAG: hypothetical protein WCF85_02455 [Rhodospirillaceae bacterium]
MSDAECARALEAAALAIGRLDAALSGHPLYPGWRLWSALEAAVRQAAADGLKVDFYRLAAAGEGVPLTTFVRLDDRGAEIVALNHALDLYRWMIRPDSGEQALCAQALERLCAESGGRSVLVATAMGLRGWLAEGGGRQPVRAAVPRFLLERGLTGQLMPGLTGTDALKAGAFDSDGFTVRFLRALARDAEAGHQRLITAERRWKAAHRAVSGRRCNSTLPLAVDALAAVPLLSISGLARTLDCSVEAASRHLRELEKLGVVTEVTGRVGRGIRRLYGFAEVEPIRFEVAGPRLRTERKRGRPADPVT